MIRPGKSPIEFEQLPQGGSIYPCFNPEDEAIIESSPLFKRGIITYYEEQTPAEVDEHRQERIASAPNADIASMRAKELDLKDARDNGMTIVDEVKTCADARLYFKKHLNLSIGFKSKEDTIKIAEEHNIYFPNLPKV